MKKQVLNKKSIVYTDEYYLYIYGERHGEYCYVIKIKDLRKDKILVDLIDKITGEAIKEMKLLKDFLDDWINEGFYVKVNFMEWNDEKYLKQIEKVNLMRFN